MENKELYAHLEQDNNFFTKLDLIKVINDAMKSDDHILSFFIDTDGSISISVCPYVEEDEDEID